MRRYLRTLLVIPFLAFSGYSQEADDVQQRIDSLEQSQMRALDELRIKQALLDSLNALVGNVYEKRGVFDSIVVPIEAGGPVYEKPDILSDQLFPVVKGEQVIVIGFEGEWFKIIHRKGVGYVLDACVTYTDVIRLYKSQRGDAGGIAPAQP